jgi:hypothetical protein
MVVVAVAATAAGAVPTNAMANARAVNLMDLTVRMEPPEQVNVNEATSPTNLLETTF